MLMLVFILAVTLFCNGVLAELSNQQWPLIKQSQYGERIIAPTAQMQLKAPLGAENAAQVPLTLTVVNIPEDSITSIALFVDANPLPLLAKYAFPVDFKVMALSTRLRMESDSHIRAIAETKSGKLLMASTVVNAGGGCAGAVADDEAHIRARAGEIKFQHNPPFTFDTSVSATLQIRHPMYTGLQTDAKTKMLKPAFYIKETSVFFDSQEILNVKFGVGTAENPYLKFVFDYAQPRENQLQDQRIGQVLINTVDNEGKSNSVRF